MLRTIFLCFSLLLVQACATNSSLIQRTGAASRIDGLWINEKCFCDGKDDHDPKLLKARTILINGNTLFQQLTGRWKQDGYVNYCTVHEEAKITRIDDSTIKVDTISHRILTPETQVCVDDSPNLSSRTWKILNVGQTELKFESSSGCEVGPLTCTYLRLDK